MAERAPSFKESCEIIRAHYQVNTKSPRKLTKLFSSNGEKNEAIVTEALRILSLRKSLGLEFSGSVCELCGIYGTQRSVKKRHRLTFKISDQMQFNGWKKWHIDRPILCRTCYYRARSVVAQYQELIELYQLCNQLKRTEPNA